MIKVILKYLRYPKLVFLKLSDFGLIRLNDKTFLELQYYNFFGKKLDLKNPQTFNEKLQWLKLYNRKDIYTIMVDKYDVKKYVANIIGEEYIIPTHGIYEKFEDINFNELPNQFVIKVTHYGGSNGVYIIKNKNDIDYEFIKKNINKLLKKNLYDYGREWPYKNVKPRIIIEKNIGININDYKFFCFNGKVKIILVCSNRFGNSVLNENFYDTNWNMLKLKRPGHPINNFIKKPKKLNEMIKLCEKLSNNIPFVRVDLFLKSDKIYFGELTFYPASGFEKFEPEIWDYNLGNDLELPKYGVENENKKNFL